MTTRTGHYEGKHIPGCNEGCDRARGIHVLGVSEGILGPLAAAQKVKAIEDHQWAALADGTTAEEDEDDCVELATQHADLVARGFDPEEAVDLISTARATSRAINLPEAGA